MVDRRLGEPGLGVVVGRAARARSRPRAGSPARRFCADAARAARGGGSSAGSRRRRRGPARAEGVGLAAGLRAPRGGGPPRPAAPARAGARPRAWRPPPPAGRAGTRARSPPRAGPPPSPRAAGRAGPGASPGASPAPGPRPLGRAVAEASTARVSSSRNSGTPSARSRMRSTTSPRQGLAAAGQLRHQRRRRDTVEAAERERVVTCSARPRAGRTRAEGDDHQHGSPPAPARPPGPAARACVGSAQCVSSYRTSTGPRAARPVELVEQRLEGPLLPRLRRQLVRAG